ncbi:MAG: hypothetical protein OEY93_01655 [Anaerolineae bacterium]|nr:hypothetical protein [Anaerolineae bacterium]
MREKINSLAVMLHKRKDAAAYTLLAVFIIVWVRNAWASDDAYITYRVVMNYISGSGLVYNLGERVQAYTHPLWFFLLSGVQFLASNIFVPLQAKFFLDYGGIYTTGLALSLAFSLAAGWLAAFKISGHSKSGWLVLLALIFSKAFVDYTSSGLENPLTYFLLAGFVWLYLHEGIDQNKKILYLSLTASLAVLNRMDTALLFAPALFYVFCKSDNKKRALLAGFAGSLVFIVWELFSLFYYGFLFPNTAYAKLNTGVLGSDLASQGIKYFINSLQLDPITLLVIFAAVCLPWLAKKWQLSALSLGILLYLLYIVKIGGDFMSGRFFAAPYLAAVLILAQFPLTTPKYKIALALAVVFIGFAGDYPPLLTTPDYRIGDVHVEETGISDERGSYFPILGLVNVNANNLPPGLGWDGWETQSARGVVVEANALGMNGFSSAPEDYVFDKIALAEPLLARLPVTNYKNWRIGHMKRDYPEGFLESLEAGENLLVDPALHEYYEKLREIVSGELFATDRLLVIWKMNTGQYNHLIEKYIENTE